MKFFTYMTRYKHVVILFNVHSASMWPALKHNTYLLQGNLSKFVAIKIESTKDYAKIKSQSMYLRSKVYLHNKVKTKRGK